MKVPLLLILGLSFSISMPALSQGPGSQQQQQQQQSRQKNQDRSRDRTHQQTQPQTRQQQQQHNRPQVQQQDRQRTQQQTRPQVQRQNREQSQPQVRQHSRERFTPRSGPPRITQRNAQPRYYRSPDGRIDRRPMYRNGVWYGRTAPNDARFRLRRPFARGHFYTYGPHYYHRIVRFNRSNYWFWLASGYYFQIAYWDWPYCSNWCWTCGDEYQIYLDPDHIGWYLILNVQTGVYVHAVFMGR